MSCKQTACKHAATNRLQKTENRLQRSSIPFPEFHSHNIRGWICMIRITQNVKVTHATLYDVIVRDFKVMSKRYHSVIKSQWYVIISLFVICFSSVCSCFHFHIQFKKYIIRMFATILPRFVNTNQICHHFFVCYLFFFCLFMLLFPDIVEKWMFHFWEGGGEDI